VKAVIEYVRLQGEIAATAAAATAAAAAAAAAAAIAAATTAALDAADSSDAHADTGTAVADAAATDAVNSSGDHILIHVLTDAHAQPKVHAFDDTAVICNDFTDDGLGMVRDHALKQLLNSHTSTCTS
jgi:hypothetical protein